jgi:hypothetical protein
MGRDQKAQTAPVLKSLPPRKPQSLQDQQFEDQRRIAERVVQALREAGYSDPGDARTLN